ncbi:MAG: hypothetical protein D6802_09915 [Ardenticatenia bacterium]|nr:MAG: hypothetical protein D6802_09915 [Ardenticatenia bacterium]
MRKILTLTFLSIALLLISCAEEEAVHETVVETLEPETTIEITLPPGGQIVYEIDDDVVFMGARIQRTTTRRIILFDKRARRKVWQVLLKGTPVRALALQNGDLIVVTSDDRQPSHLLRLERSTGKIVWERTFEQPAIDVAVLKEAVIVSDGVTLWQIDPATGDFVTTWAQHVGETQSPSSVYLETGTDGSYLYLASDRLLTAFAVRDHQVQEMWRFKSPKFIAELKAVRFSSGEEGVLVLSHSHAYFVDINGKRRWHIENSDINYGAVAFPTPTAATGIAFANYVKGIYVVLPDGTFMNAPLPGGNVRVLGIPLPIPKNVLLGGMTVRPVKGREHESYWLSVRSLDSLFLYQFTVPDELSLVAQASLANDKGSFIEKANMNPNYPPLWLDHSIALTTPKGLVLFRRKGS